MKRNTSAGWLILSLLPLFAFTWLSLANADHHAVRAPIAADQVSAELARTVSYGFVDQDEQQAPVLRRHEAGQPASHSVQPASALRMSRLGATVGL